MSINWSDVTIVGIIAGFAIIGLLSGFIISVYRIASYFIAIYISIKYYPAVAKLFKKLPIYENLRTSITNNLKDIPALSTVQPVEGDMSTQIDNTMGAVTDNLNLPGFLKGPLLEQMPDLSKMVDFSSIIEGIGGSVTELIVNIVSLILLFIVVRLALMIIKHILKGIAKLPVFKQLDKIGGFAFGAVEGLLMVYVILAVLMLFQTTPVFSSVFDTINSSVVAKFFYQNNFIVEWMF